MSRLTALAEVDSAGRFARTASVFREIISPSHPKFQPGAGRYHLYISLACPWANRCLSIINLKGLTRSIGVSVVHPTWQRTRPSDPSDSHCGWVFHPSSSDTPLVSTGGHGAFLPPGCDADDVNGTTNVRELYDLAGAQSLSKFTVPLLWDKLHCTIVNNESSEIMRMLNDCFDCGGEQSDTRTALSDHDFYPPDRRDVIDGVNAWVYTQINNGVYMCGFAKTQLAYDEAIDALFSGLDKVEEILSSSRYIAGDTLTEADVRLFMTTVRFDEVYVVYFKCNKKRIADYPAIRNWMRDLFQLPGMSASIDMRHIKTHYFTSHTVLNPYAIIPRGPDVIEDLKQPHNRESL